MDLTRASFLGAVATVLSSCAVVTSTLQAGNNSSAVSSADTTYSLPRTVFNVSAGKSDKGEVLLSVTKGAEPDPNARFLFHYQGSPFSDDDVTAETTPDGLLANIKSSATDRSGEIAVNLAEAIFTIGTAGAALPSVRRLPTDAELKTGFFASYDPLDPSDVKRTRGPLARAGSCILVGRDETSYGPTLCDAEATLATLPNLLTRTGHSGGSVADASGVFYRQLSAQPINIYKRSKAGWESVFVGNETLFDKQAIYQVDINRAAFVEKHVNLTFDSGVLKEIEVKKPSQLLALSTFGLQIVKIAVAIPLSALKQNTALKDAKAANVQAQTTLLQRQDELLQLQVEREGSTQDNVVRSRVDFVDAGARSLGRGGSGSANEISICQSNLATSVADCRAFLERGSGDF